MRKLLTISTLVTLLLLIPFLSTKAEPFSTNSTDTAMYNVLTPIGTYTITGYVPTCMHCCGKTNGITKSGAVAEIGVTVAMKDIEFGTRILIVGIGERVVQDRGCRSNVIDVACASHDDCYALTGSYEVYIIN